MMLRNFVTATVRITRCPFYLITILKSNLQKATIFIMFMIVFLNIFLVWLAPFGCFYYFRSFSAIKWSYPSSFKVNPGIEPTSKDHGSDCESSTFTTRPGIFPMFIIVLSNIIWLISGPRGWRPRRPGRTLSPTATTAPPTPRARPRRRATSTSRLWPHSPICPRSSGKGSLVNDVTHVFKKVWNPSFTVLQLDFLKSFLVRGYPYMMWQVL